MYARAVCMHDNSKTYTNQRCTDLWAKINLVKRLCVSTYSAFRSELVSVSRNSAPWCHFQCSERGDHSVLWVDGRSRYLVLTSVCVRASRYQHLPCPPFLSSLPLGIETRELDQLLVIVKTTARNPSFLSVVRLLTFSLQFHRSHVRQSDLEHVQSSR